MRLLDIVGFARTTGVVRCDTPLRLPVVLLDVSSRPGAVIRQDNVAFPKADNEIQLVRTPICSYAA
jgi:hypothetical protein